MIIERTFSYQDTLPKLPVPPLDHTKEKLIEWVEPLIQPSQFKQTRTVIERFFASNGEAEKLQKQLHAWDQSRKGSWLTPFWDEAYLTHRDGLPYSMNFNVLLENEAYKHRYSIMEMAGTISFLVTELYHQIIDEEIKPSKMKDMPLDMGQYKKFFRSIRLPQKSRDITYVAEMDKRKNHVVFIYKNYIYQVQVTDDQGRIFPSDMITAAMKEAIQSEQDYGINVGLFTTAERDVAAHVYEKLRNSKVNKDLLQTIADALIVLSIDDESESSEEAIRNLMLGVTNKYFDKTIQVIITKNSEIGFNVEHSAVDGTSIATVISHVSKGLVKDLIFNDPAKGTPIVEKKEWELSDTLLQMIGQFQNDHVKRRKEYALHPKIFSEFGAEAIKNMRMSPDAFFHMALQLAQYRTYGTFYSVYQPVAVRFFNEGRTECARATSMEKRAVVEAIEGGDHNDKEIYAFMQQASDAHTTRIRACQKGFGVERHLTGLKQMFHLYGEELGMTEIPELFQDEGYIALRHDFISSSGIAYADAKYRMFAPVEKEGHGVAYFIIDDSISVNISSFIGNETNGNELMNQMIRALQELKEIATKAIAL